MIADAVGVAPHRMVSALPGIPSATPMRTSLIGEPSGSFRSIGREGKPPGMSAMVRKSLVKCVAKYPLRRADQGAQRFHYPHILTLLWES